MTLDELLDRYATGGSYSMMLTPFVEAKINLAALLASQDALLRHVHQIPNLDGASYKILKPFCGGAAQKAQLLLAVGEYLGWWSRSPRLEQHAGWADVLAPRIALGSLRLPPPSEEPQHGVPKPSRGDLAQLVYCRQCGSAASMDKAHADQAYGIYIVDQNALLCQVCDRTPRREPRLPPKEKISEEYPGIPEGVPEGLEIFLE